MQSFRNISLFFQLLVYSIFTAYYTEECGITTHIEISHRAAHNYEGFSLGVKYGELISKHQDAFVAGSPYPDAFYNSLCVNGIYHDVSEDTHWAPFINATVNYIHKNYPQPWDTATEKLVVFMFGIVSHQTADILWHSLGIQQGFLQTMSKINFHGSFSDAHSVGDVGGDVLNEFEMDLRYIDVVGEWYVPVDDLYKIYEELYGSPLIPKDVITDCSMMLYLGSLGEKIIFSKLFPNIAKKGPFLVDQLSDFFLGGMDDMAGWTQKIWNEVIVMMEKGPDYCSIPKNTLFLQCNKSSTSLEMPARMDPAKNGFFVEPQLNGLNKFNIDIKKSLRGIQITPKPKLKKMLVNLEKKRKHRVEHSMSISKKQTRNPDFIYTVSEPYSKVGWSLAIGDLNNDGHDDLVVGAPGYGEEESPQQGRVFIVYGSAFGLPKKNLDLNSADVILRGPVMAQSRFGSTVAVLDMNLDGINDLAVGAPSMSYTTLLGYNGEVLVYLADPNTAELTAPNLTVRCQSQYCNLGWSLTVGDVDGDGHKDLIIGSPFAPATGEQIGMIAAIPASKSISGSVIINVESLSWKLSGSQNYGWFSHDIQVKDTGAEKLMLVSQPTFRKCDLINCSFSVNDTQSTGQLHIYRLEAGLPIFVKVLTGYGEFEQAGFSSDLGRPYGNVPLVMAVGGPSLGIKGKVIGIPVELSQAGVVTLINITSWNSTQLAVFRGDRPYGRFGKLVKFADVNLDGYDDLIITAPLWTKDLSQRLVGAQQGLVFIYYGGKGFPHGNATSGCGLSPVQPCPEKKASLTLSFGEDKARFGTGIAVLKAKNKVNLLITAAHSSKGARLSGAIALYTFP